MTFRSTLARRWAACIVCAAAWVPASWAAPLPGTLSITASAALDTANSSLTGATASGTTFATVGGADTPPGASTTASFVGTGDTIFVDYVVNGGVGSAESRLFFDVSFLLANTSATDTYTLSFDIDIALDATVAGSNAFSLNDLSVRDAANNEVFFAFFNADTIASNNSSDPGQGANPLTIVLAPGASTSFTALLGHRGGAFPADGQYTGRGSLSIALQDVTSSGGPTPVPAPATLALVMLALPLLGATRRARRKLLPT